MAKTNRPTGNEDTTFTRCRRCGFPCDTSRDKTGDGSGLTYVSVSHTATYCPDDPTVVAGCPQCGSKNFMNWQR